MSLGKGLSRRRFFKSLVGGAAALYGLARGLPEALGGEPIIRPKGRRLGPAGSLPRRPLGLTGEQVSIFALGGQSTLETPGKRDQGLAIIHRALDLGVNYLDTAAVYGGGVSELLFGEVMATRRGEAFLSSKTVDRSYDGSMRVLDTSLKRLRTDHLDLWMLHDVRTQQDLDFVFARGGALEALVKARNQGLTRFIGISGHRDPFILRAAIERHPFDVILMALNAGDRHAPTSFIEHLLPAAVQRQMGIAAMKIPSRGRLFRPGGITTMRDALRYVLSLPVSTGVVGISTLEELEENVAIASALQPCTPAEMAQLESLTAPYYAEAIWYQREW